MRQSLLLRGITKTHSLFDSAASFRCFSMFQSHDIDSNYLTQTISTYPTITYACYIFEHTHILYQRFVYYHHLRGPQGYGHAGAGRLWFGCLPMLSLLWIELCIPIAFSLSLSRCHLCIVHVLTVTYASRVSPPFVFQSQQHLIAAVSISTAILRWFSEMAFSTRQHAAEWPRMGSIGLLHSFDAPCLYTIE